MSTPTRRIFSDSAIALSITGEMGLAALYTFAIGLIMINIRRLISR